MQAISWPGYQPQAILLVVAVVLPIYALGFRWEAVMCGLSTAGTHLLNLAIKAIVHRPRPSADIVHAFRILEDFSFPSGHVMFYLGFFGFLWFLAYTLLSRSWKRTLLLLLLGSLVGLVGLSRIYLGEHWASDVLGAYIAGSLALVVAIQVYRYLFSQNRVSGVK
jgi:undecaprenyl-diphosphatase